MRAMDGPRAAVLLYVLYPSHFKVMYRVARLLVSTGRYAPIIYFDRSRPYPRDVEQALSAGIRCLGPDGEELTPVDATREPWKRPWGDLLPSVIRAAQRLVQRLPDDIREPLGDLSVASMFLPLFASELSDSVRVRRRLRRMLARDDVRLVIAPGDSVGYATPNLIRAAHDRGVRSLIVPFTVSNALEMAADLKRYRHFSTSRLDNLLVAQLFPQWQYVHQGHRMIRLPAPQAMVHQVWGVTPPNPWVLNSGYADALAVESQYMWDYYERAGLDARHFVLTGALGDDAAAAALDKAGPRRGELYAELGLPPGRKMVLFSYGEYHYFFQSGRASEFANQEELTRFWLESLRAMPGYNVVLSLHPSLKREDMEHLQSAGVKISTRPIEELIPLCDVYVVSISATTRTAIACGKPVVDHDVFGFDYDNFVGMDAVWVTHTRADFAGTLRRLAADEAFFQRAVEAQRRVAPRFGTLDGRVHERMIALVDRLADAAATSPAVHGAPERMASDGS